MLASVRSFFAPKPDPITGDMLDFSDRVSWFAQGVIRRWTWVLFNIIFSVTWWLHPQFFHDDPVTLFRWMAIYSLMAIVVESIVGIGQFQQNKRDAVVLRQISKMVDSQQTLLAAILQRDEHIEDLEEDILESMD